MARIENLEAELEKEQRLCYDVRLVANNLKYYRGVMEMSHVELAKASGVSRQTILKTEKPDWYEHRPNVKTLSNLACALGISLYHLFDPKLR